ncbi:MAG: Cytochrome c-type biogenesis protein DsbD, protein-disulfide reductase [Rhodanobacteraceae bacterium]|jgi:thiol:disulfide interchange protein DsbD|nr:MAG: Cytochrome c-type biogenesis protein DsbD, protein-disulfide reductase [Rhodanobacteraceae bacterium]
MCGSSLDVIPDMPVVRRFPSPLLLFATLLLAAAGAFAQSVSPGDGLLQVTQAFALKASIAKPGAVALHFDIAPHYYLYRGRIHAKILTPGIAAGALRTPAGIKEHDPYLGDVEIYHGAIDASQPYSAAGAMPAMLKVEVSYQGCHEVEPRICYPPNTQTFTLPTSGGGPVGAADGGDGAARNPITASLATTSRAPASVDAANAQVAGPIDMGLAFALLLAFIGGLILNLMPCVLPVLAIKAVGVLESGESRQRARAHALAYAAGVIATFLAIGLAILGLRGAGHAVGWGTQLQQPLIVAVLACVLFAVGLSMSGVVQFGAGLGNLGSGLTQRGGAAGHFFTGVLAVVVASPCTAPFMGVALAYALVAPPSHELLVMLALGIGLALPLTLIGLVPALARLLPKPGRWMETLKQILAFPMYLSAVWLVWVLAHQRGADAVALVLVTMVLLAAASWWHGRGGPARRIGHAFTLALVLAGLASLYAIAQVAPPARAAASDGSSVAFSPVKLQSLRAAGTPVFVDIGADWCVTCKANEYAVLDTRGFKNLLAQTGAVYMKGDWTDVDPEIGAYLKQFHSPGVPLYVVYPRGGGAGRALPTVLTASVVRAALETASR